MQNDDEYDSLISIHGNLLDQDLVDESAFNHFVIANCIEACIQQTRSHLAHTFTDAQQQIADTVNRKGIKHKLAYDELNHLLKAVERDKSAIIEAVVSDLSNYLNYAAFLSTESAPHSPLNKQSLITEKHKAIFHLNLFAATLSRDISFKTHTELSVLNQKFAYLRGLRNSYPGWINPFKPDVFVRAILNSLNKIDLNENQKQIFLHAASFRLSQSIREIYKDLIAISEKNSIPVADTSMTEYSFGSSFDYSINDIYEKTIFNNHRFSHGEIQAQIIENEVLPPSPIANETGFSSKELNDLKHLLNPGGSMATGFIESLVTSFPRMCSLSFVGATNKLNERLLRKSRLSKKEATQQLVSRLMSKVCADSRILPELQKQLARLIGPLLNVAEIDPSFVVNHEHPARLFIEFVAAKSLLYSAEKDAGYKAFHASLRYAVDILLSSKDHPLNTMSKAHIWLGEKWGSPIYNCVEVKPSGDSLIKEAIIRNIRAYKEFIKIKDDFAMLDKAPAYIIDFISGPWANVIARLEIKPATNGRMFSKAMAVQTLKLLLWSLDSKNAKQNLPAFKNTITEINENIRIGLDVLDVADSDEVISGFFRRLHRHHDLIELISKSETAESLKAQSAFLNESILGKAPADALWLTSNESRAVGLIGASSTTTDSPAMPYHNSNHEYFNGIRSIKAGDLFEININDDWNRVTLEWCNMPNFNQATVYIFKNATGNLITLSNKQLSGLSSTGKIKPLSIKPVFSTAMEMLLS